MLTCVALFFFFFFFYMAPSLLTCVFRYWSRSLGAKMRHVMQTSTFRKILETSVQSRDKLGSGKMYTLITGDAEIM